MSEPYHWEGVQNVLNIICAIRKPDHCIFLRILSPVFPKGLAFQFDVGTNVTSREHKSHHEVMTLIISPRQSIRIWVMNIDDSLISLPFQVIFVAKRNIKKGEEVTECYGIHHLSMTKQDRQAKLEKGK